MSTISHILGHFFRPTNWFLSSSTRSDSDIRVLSSDLLSAKGEVSGATIARQILNQYRELDEEGKLSYFQFILAEMDFDSAGVKSALSTYTTHHDAKSYGQFIAAAQPQWRQFFRRLNEAPDATFDLVNMRADLLRLMRAHSELEVIDIDLRDLFLSWFNRGFLVLRPISWSSPASILEKIISYEAVHEISSWDDLRRRLQPSDRCCFAFFHPTMPDEPLIFVEVALTDSLPASVQTILAQDGEVTSGEDMDYAVFYSISNCQKGLAGISFGNALIKTVVEELKQQYPSIKHYLTLSPLPGFTKWLTSLPAQDHDGEAQDMLTLATHQEQIRIPLAAAYLSQAKRENGMPVDPVARFHLGNGARIHQLHIDADTSDHGMKQSLGVMVNYLYQPDELIENHENFVNAGTIKADKAVKDHAQKAKTYLPSRV
jgi:malonyl-CoA decarboxylase